MNVNLEYLDLMTDGDPDMRDTMLGMLQDELPAEIEKMEQLTELHDWAMLREVSHKMKSTLAFIGNEAMTFANREIEDCCKTGHGHHGRIVHHLAVLTRHLPYVMEELQSEQHLVLA